MAEKNAWGAAADSEASATTTERWRNDVVGGEMLQQRPEAIA